MPELKENALVDGRYRVKDRIGSGGMADVFLADDIHLGREVAIKVLHARFAQDAGFVERFRREASAAAGLQHPNVVNVFDRGEHDGTYYIAMECLRGRTLKDLIVEEAPLAGDRAVRLGVQILRAAAFAHSRGIIHRDFKPQNVIVGEGDALKVTDFGIARAGASDMTETGSIMGTAQYLSPEQAQGHSVTPASDLYSIGVVMYEMLSGHVPFGGDSAVAIALRHLSDPPPPLSSHRHGVSPELEAVVMRALAKAPEDRYADADAFIAALESARTAAEEPPTHATAVFAPVPAPVPTERVVERVEEPLEPDRDQRRSRWPWILLALLALALLALGLYAAAQSDDVGVPGVVGQDLRPARARLEAAGFDVDLERVRNAAPPDRVVAQNPGAGAEVDRGSSVELQVSEGPGERTVPRVSGLSERDAVARLNRAGFRVESELRSSPDVLKGRAVRTVPPSGTAEQVGSRIRLLISSGPREVEVPNVVGLSRSQAESRLSNEGLDAEISEQESEQPAGEVTGQSPDAGVAAEEGTRVSITVSTGVTQVEVPSVEGDDRARARARLGAAGFEVEVRERSVDSESLDGEVVEQRPPAGSERRRGSTVTIFVGAFDAAASGDPPLAPPDAGQ